MKKTKPKTKKRKTLTRPKAKVTTTAKAKIRPKPKAKTKPKPLPLTPHQGIKGYKVFLPDFTSKHGGIKFKENADFEVKLPLSMCNWGIHFCTKAQHCFSYYDFDPKNIVCEVESLGETLTHSQDSKVCTNRLHVGRRLSWDEVLVLANDGLNNTGHSNSGDRNSGDSNTTTKIFIKAWNP